MPSLAALASDVKSEVTGPDWRIAYHCRFHIALKWLLICIQSPTADCSDDEDAVSHVFKPSSQLISKQTAARYEKESCQSGCLRANGHYHGHEVEPDCSWDLSTMTETIKSPLLNNLFDYLKI